MTSDSKQEQQQETSAARERARAAAKRVAGSRKRSGSFFNFDADRTSRLLLLAGVALVLIIAAGFIAFGYYQTEIKPKNRTVLGAAGINISYSAMKRRMSYDLRTNPAFGQSQQALLSLPATASAELLTEIILVQRAPSEQGITVTSDEVDQALRTRIGVAQDATQQQFAQSLATALKSSGLTQGEYRRMVEANVIQTKLQKKFTDSLPATLPQAKFDVISTDDQDKANQALLRVKAGQDWATVAKDLSTATDVSTTGGAHDYTPEGSLPSAYSGFLFSAANGTISDVINDGAPTPTYYIVRLDDRADKALTDAQKPDAASQAYSQWLDSMQSQITIVNHWDQTSQLTALDDVVRNTPAPTPASATTVTVPVQPVTNATPAVPNAPVAPASPSAP